jgi:DNA-directed RNA polymerase subunit H (RpoH/RPB5)
MSSSNKLDELKEWTSKFEPTGYVQWDIYQILKHAFCPYRSIKVDEKDLTKDDLQKNLQFDGYVKFEGTDLKGDKILIALLSQNDKGTNEISQTTEKFRVFMNNVRSDKIKKILVVSPGDFSTHILNYIYAQPDLAEMLQIHHYDRFKVVVPLGPYCSEHRILSNEEAKEFIDYNKIEVQMMKKIYMDDPQIIWLGAEPGQYILITRLSRSSGRSNELRKVAL